MGFSPEEVVRKGIGDEAADLLRQFIDQHGMLGASLQSWYRNDIDTANEHLRMALKHFSAYADQIATNASTAIPGVKSLLPRFTHDISTEEDGVARAAYDTLRDRNIAVPETYDDFFQRIGDLSKHAQNELSGKRYSDSMSGHKAALETIKVVNYQADGLEALTIASLLPKPKG